MKKVSLLSALTAVLGITSQVALADHGHGAQLVGNVYAMDNGPEENRVIAYGRFDNGELRYFGSVRTGGVGGNDTETPLGDGFDPLGSQDPMILSDDGRFLYVVNIGTHDISAFYLTNSGRPILIQRISSGGFFPASLAVDGNLMYALNSGGEGRIVGFRIQENGRLIRIPGAERSLGLDFEETPLAFDRILAPNDIVFDTLNRRLVVVYAGGGEFVESPFPDLLPTITTGELWSWSVEDDGMLSAEHTVTASAGLIPFGLDFTRHGIALVSDAVSGALSSYTFTGAGSQMEVVSGAVPATGQATSCWVRVTDSGIAYIANSISRSLSSYRVTRNGVVTLLDPTAVSDIGEPVDFDFSPDDRYMYVTTSSEGGVRALRVNDQTGETQSIGTYPGLPSFPVDGYAPAGLVVR